MKVVVAQPLTPTEVKAMTNLRQREVELGSKAYPQLINPQIVATLHTDLRGRRVVCAP
jgi:hypothetical protein